MKQEVPVELVQAGAGASVSSRPLGYVPAPARISSFIGPQGRVALLSNRRAHRNRSAAELAQVPSDVRLVSPHSKAELDRSLAALAQDRIGTIVIDGGDGTIRDVLTLAPRHFPEGLPRIAVVPSGKTNALAIDLGIAGRWTAPEVLASLGRWKTIARSPLEIRYDGDHEPRLRGFLFGTGAFVRATNLAQSVHRAGAFSGLAVGLSLAGGVGQTLFGKADNVWRRGDEVTLELADGSAITRRFYLLLGSTLQRLPLGLKPFGAERAGFKLLGVDAPPRRIMTTLPALLMGSESQRLSDAGYNRADTDTVRLRIDSGFVLDGETFAGGDLTISQGAPVDFLIPA